MADNFAQTVKQQADIVRIVGDYVKLRKSGANWSALCPFHKEKSGSFYLYPTTASYYCFGCHEHGDVFTFVMKMDNVSFPEAVRSVATKMGIPLPQREFSSPQEAREAGLRKQLLEIHEAATQYFQQNLQSPEAARAREYMTRRGITPETIKTFRLGYAPESFNDMRDRLGKFFSEEVMRASGLFSSKERDDGSSGPLYARFRKRITFPSAMNRASRSRSRRACWTQSTISPDQNISTRPRPLSTQKVRCCSTWTRRRLELKSWASCCWWRARWIASRSTWVACRT